MTSNTPATTTNAGSSLTSKTVSMSSTQGKILMYGLVIVAAIGIPIAYVVGKRA